MKLNETGHYIVTEGENFIVDPKTEERMLFLLDEEHRLVIRSMLQEDINIFIQMFDATSKEKRKKKRILYDAIPKKDSELYFFAIERIVGEKKTDNWNEIYEMQRVPVGIGARTDELRTVTGKIGAEIQFYIYTEEEKCCSFIKPMIKRLADVFGIEGDATIFPVN